MTANSSTPSHDFQQFYRKRRKRRIYFIIFCLIFLAAACFLTLYALRNQVDFFRLPSEITEADRHSAYRFRLGGYVEKGSVQHTDDAMIVFNITDYDHSVAVHYQGLVPDLFQEDQGVIAEGQFVDNVFVANRVLAKHDETYIPPGLETIEKPQQSSGAGS